MTVDPDTWAKLIQTAVISGVAVALFFGMKGRIVAFARRANLPTLALGPVRILLRASILIVAGVLILGRWGYQLDTLLTVIGTVLGLIAIGFVAMWSVLSNFLCTFVLIVFKPFYVGDELELPNGNIRGRVVDLSLIFTTLETAPGESVLVPNNLFFQTQFKRKAGGRGVDLEHQLRESTPHRRDMERHADDSVGSLDPAGVAVSRTLSD